MTSNFGNNLEISPEAYKSIKGSLSSFSAALRPLFDAYKSHWEPGSLAAKEATSFPGSEALATAYTQASLAILVAGDHLAAIDRVLTEPVMTFAPWTALRAVLESSATSLWLLEKGISAEERVTRSMALRYQHLLDAKTFWREAVGRDSEDRDRIRTATQHVDQRLRNIESTAKARNIKLKHDGRDRVIGIGDGVPDLVVLIERTLGERQMFRLLSGLAHGRTWVQLALSLRRVAGVKAVTQHLDPIAATNVMIDAIIWFSRAVWAYFDLTGRDLDALKKIMEQQYDQAHLKAETRFWRTLDAGQV